ncbi:MAG: hypothetical protein R3228_00205 [Halioglobus sp.]|nr:hypothetical protein [Halioglobus sp.]
MHLDEIVSWIDRAFGPENMDNYRAGLDGDVHALREVLGEDGFQRYFRDQVNRQIIRDYLTNAVVLGVITEGGLAAFAADIATEEGRATLALYMLMSSVDDARDLLPASGELQPLAPQSPTPGDRSHIKLVPR